MAKKKKAHHEEHMDESWLIPYADLLTLLLALFIVLFATSNKPDQAKMAQMSDAFQSMMASSSIMPGGSGSPNMIQILPNPIVVPPPINKPPKENAGNAGDQQKGQMEQLESDFKTYVMDNGLAEAVEVEEKEGGVLLTLKGDVWFASGSADISPSHVKVAKEIAGMIVENQQGKENFKVVVTGHTDNRPIGTTRFPSNWVLSLMRASNFLAVLVEQTKLDPHFFSAGGMGEYEPIASNDTAEGRQQNRRVEVFISTRETTLVPKTDAEAPVPTPANVPAPGTGAIMPPPTKTP